MNNPYISYMVGLLMGIILTLFVNNAFSKTIKECYKQTVPHEKMMHPMACPGGLK